MARDYAAEYRRRIERGLSQGKTRQEARGHREEIRAPGEESSYATRQTRTIARRLRDAYNGDNNNGPQLSRADSITLAYQYTDRWGIPKTRKLLDMREHVAALYRDRDLEYETAADELGDYYDTLNDRSYLTDIILERDHDNWEEYHYIDFGDPPEYAVCLFYH